MTGYLLDTNHLGEAITKVSRIRELLYQKHRVGIRFGTCIPVLCELEAGIQQTKDVAGNRRRLKNLLAVGRMWPLDQTIARKYGEVFQILKKAGRAVSQVDMLLAALSLDNDLTLLTTDTDFTALPKIRTENWL